MTMDLDHFAVATPALDAAVAHFSEATGVRPAAGGSHPGKGTRNALITLGPELYLAIDGPDHEQPLVDNNGAVFSRLSQPTMNAYVVRTDDLAAARSTLERRGYECSEERLNRFTPDGEEIAWLSLAVSGHGFDRAMPVITQWLTKNHPASTAPQGCRLRAFRVSHPRDAELTELFEELGLHAAVVNAPATALHLEVEGPSGNIAYGYHWD